MKNPYSNIPNIKIMEVLENLKSLQGNVNLNAYNEMNTVIKNNMWQFKALQDHINEIQNPIKILKMNNLNTNRIDLNIPSIMPYKLFIDSIKPEAISQLQDLINSISLTQSINNSLTEIIEIAEQIKALNIPEGFSFADISEDIAEADNIDLNENLDQDTTLEESFSEAISELDDDPEIYLDDGDQMNLNEIQTLLVSLYCHLFSEWNTEVFEEIINLLAISLSVISATEEGMKFLTDTYNFFNSIIGIIGALPILINAATYYNQNKQSKAKK